MVFRWPVVIQISNSFFVNTIFLPTGIKYCRCDWLFYRMLLLRLFTLKLKLSKYLSCFNKFIVVNTNSSEDHSIRRVIALEKIHQDGPVDGRVHVTLGTHLGQAEGVVGEGSCVNGLHHVGFLIRPKFRIFQLKSVTHSIVKQLSYT